MSPLFNMNNIKLGRDTMQVAETAEVLPDDQNDSRKGRRSQIVVTDETVVFDISQQLRLPMADVSLDLSEGYDRMLHNATMLSMIQHGAPETAVHSTFETLANAEHFVLTAYGRFTKSYGGRKHNRARKLTPQGVGQGSGKGPTAFGTYSSTIIKAMRKKGYGAMFSACISMFVMTLICFMYVDDTKLVHTARNQEETGEEIVSATQEELDYWCGLVGCTGGKINPDKSNWCLIDYEWTGSKWVYRNIKSMEGSLTIQDLEGETNSSNKLNPQRHLKLWESCWQQMDP